MRKQDEPRAKWILAAMVWQGALAVGLFYLGFPFFIFACLATIGVFVLLGEWMLVAGRSFDFRSVWRLFPFILPHALRERVYEPAHQELLEDYIIVRRHRNKWAKRWLTFCFAWRTAWLIVQCFQAMFADRAARALGKLVPAPVKRWWLSR